MKQLKAITTAILTLLCGAYLGFGAQDPPKQRAAVYVWDFTDRALEKTTLTENFTRDFETALKSSRAFRILERRNIDRILAHSENEKKITHTTDLPQTAITEMKTTKAEMVVFGEVYDDTASGEVSVTVTFEDFTGEKIYMEAIQMRRGLRDDTDSRRSKMKELVEKLTDNQRRQDEAIRDEAVKLTPVAQPKSVMKTNEESLGIKEKETKAQDSKAISQTFGDLNIVFESLRVLDKQTILVNLIFQNKGDKNAIGVGVYREAPPEGGYNYIYRSDGPPFVPPIPLRSTLLGSDGLQFESDGKDLAGIRPIRSDTKDLIEISPGEEIKTSFKYRTRDRVSVVSPSFRLQAEIVMRAITPYSVYGSWAGELSSDCKIHNLVLDIPVRGK